MAKFKVGDKVNCADYGNGVITKIITSVMPEIPYYVVFESGKEIYLGADRLTLPVAREFIVIRRDGAKTIAELRHDREVIKSGTAICNASDAFDFYTGAQLAFDRLMGREEPKPAPQTAHRFKVGDRVVYEAREVGVVKEINVTVMPQVPYLVEFEDGSMWLADCRLSPAPAPEPPKYIPQIGDRVVTNFGIGSVIRISGSGEAGVWHDTWDEGHNFHGIFDGLSGYRGWWVNYSNVKPLMEPSDV